jgi:hypothetical protein
MVFTIRGLVRLQLISENYSRRLSIFRLFTQPGSKTEVLLLERHVRSTPKSRPRQASPTCPFRAKMRH